MVFAANCVMQKGKAYLLLHLTHCPHNYVTVIVRRAVREREEHEKEMKAEKPQVAHKEKACALPTAA